MSLKNAKPCKIMILGGTGVGKSNYIKTLQKYSFDKFHNKIGVNTIKRTTMVYHLDKEKKNIIKLDVDEIDAVYSKWLVEEWENGRKQFYDGLL